MLVIHAGPSSRTLELCERALIQGKAVFAIESPHNVGLRNLGAVMLAPADVGAILRSPGRANENLA
ncbi:MAG: hypothetical protein GEU73_08410 [Chloroflexi bacterium]|nr:hypothetical protein [Chloroflexota bacterium]